MSERRAEGDLPRVSRDTDDRDGAAGDTNDCVNLSDVDAQRPSQGAHKRGVLILQGGAALDGAGVALAGSNRKGELG